jgi:hypothetical protein
MLSCWRRLSALDPLPVLLGIVEHHQRCEFGARVEYHVTTLKAARPAAPSSRDKVDGCAKAFGRQIEGDFFHTVSGEERGQDDYRAC